MDYVKAIMELKLEKEHSGAFFPRRGDGLEIITSTMICGLLCRNKNVVSFTENGMKFPAFPSVCQAKRFITVVRWLFSDDEFYQHFGNISTTQNCTKMIHFAVRELHRTIKQDNGRPYDDTNYLYECIARKLASIREKSACI